MKRDVPLNFVGIMAPAKLSRPLYEGGERCGQRDFILREETVISRTPVWPPKAIATDCHCIRDPHDDHVHECVCGKRWAA